MRFKAKAKCIQNWQGYNKQYSVKEGDEVEGYYYKDVLDNEDSCSYIHVHYIRIEYGDHYGDIEIDPNTLTDDLERQLEEAREAIKEHKRRKKSWGFEGADYDKDLWDQLKEKG
jgi:hypothetical protein